MGFSAALYNVILSTIKDGCLGQSGPMTGLAQMQEQSVFPLAAPVSNVKMPHIIVRLPAEPYATFNWVSTSEKRDGLMVVDVDVVTELRQTIEQPYGSENLMGVLTLTDDVCDLLEAQRLKIMKASEKLVDYELSSSAHSRQTPDGLGVVTTTRVVFKTRFQAGHR